MPNLTPEARSLRARLAAHHRWAQHDPVEGTAKARSNGPGQIEYWLAKVDPDNELSPTERARRAESARKAHFTSLAYKSAKARRGGGSGATDDAA